MSDLLTQFACVFRLIHDVDHQGVPTHSSSCGEKTDIAILQVWKEYRRAKTRSIGLSFLMSND
jgi:hypothetical protein